MDTNTSILIFNLFLNFLVVIDHAITRLKKSSCWGFNLEMKEEEKKVKQEQDEEKEEKKIDIKIDKL